MLVQRVRERPSLLLGATLVAGAAAQTLVALATDTPAARSAAFVLWVAAVMCAALTVAVLGRTYHAAPAAPDDAPGPVRVTWHAGFPSAGRVGPEARLHAHATGFRIVGATRSGGDVAAFALAVLAGWAAGGWWGAIAVSSWAWAAGFPRPRRVALDVAWDDVEAATVAGAAHFLVRLRDARPEIRLEARYSQRERLTAILADRLGPRFAGPAAARDAPTPPPVPVVAPVFDEDDEEDPHVGAVLWSRLRARPLLVVAAAALFAAVVLHAATIISAAQWTAVGALAATSVSAVFSTLAVLTRRGDAGPAPPRPGDVAAPLPARWRNRPGWTGPRDAHVHVRDDGLRVVGSEWEMFDVVLVVGGAIVSWGASGGFGLAAAGVLVSALGFPRSRRVSVDVAWTDVTSATTSGRATEVRTRLAPPFDRVELEVQYSARERLVAELDRRLGARYRLDPRVPADAFVAARPPSAADVAAQTERLRHSGETTDAR